MDLTEFSSVTLTIFSWIWSQSSVFRKWLNQKQWTWLNLVLWHQPLAVKFDLKVVFSRNGWKCAQRLALQNSSLTKISQKILHVIRVITQIKRQVNCLHGLHWTKTWQNISMSLSLMTSGLLSVKQCAGTVFKFYCPLDNKVRTSSW